LSSSFTYKRLNDFGIFNEQEVSACKYSMLKMSRNINNQVIHPSQKGSVGSSIFDKSGPDFEKIGLVSYQNFMVPWMIKKKK
jgi:hypothetical protein